MFRISKIRTKISFARQKMTKKLSQRENTDKKLKGK